MTKKQRIDDIKAAITETYKTRHAVNRRYCRTALTDVREYISKIRSLS